MADQNVFEKLTQIIKNWQERLIDISKSNPLLGLNRSRAARLEITSPNFSFLTKTLVDDEGQIKMPFVQKKVQRKLLEDESSDQDEDEQYVLQKGDIDFIFNSLGDLRRKVRKIYDSSRSSLVERGVNTLYLALGCLNWEDGIMGKSESPIIMIPCEFEYKGASKALILKMADGDALLNPALHYYLDKKEEIYLPGPELSEDFGQEKIGEILKTIADQVKPNGWTVSNRAWVGIFSFESLAIYQDLKALETEAKNSKLIQALAHVNGDEVIKNISLREELDDLPMPQEVPLPVVQADSSQLKALTLGARGANLVIHGPPGTGKSQTITGIIANALGQKKRVLFVSAKMAALNVVHNRLQSMGLGQYCLEAHGVKSGKRKVIDELKKTLESNDDIKIAKNVDDDLKKMVDDRSRLNEYVKALHDSHNAMSTSLYSVFGKYETLKDVELVKAPLPLQWDDIAQISQAELGKKIDVLREVSEHADKFTHKDVHPLRGLKSGNIDQISLEKLEASYNELIAFCDSVASNIKKCDQFLSQADLRVDDLFASISFFNMLASITHLPDGWNNSNDEADAVTVKDVIECQDIIREIKKLHDEFHASTSKSPAEIIDIFGRFKSKYPSWYHKLNAQYFKDKKKCKEVIDRSRTFSISLLEKLSQKGKKLIDLDKILTERLSHYPLVEKDREDKIDLLDSIKHEYEAAIAIRAWLSETKATIAVTPKFAKQESDYFAKLADILSSSKQGISKILNDISSKWPDGLYGQIKFENIPISQIINMAKDIVIHLNQSRMRDWQIIVKLVNSCNEHGLTPFLQKIDSKNLSIVPKIFEKRFYSLWIDAVIHSREVLSEFSEVSHGELIRKFKSLDEKLLHLALINTIAEPAKIAKQVKIAHSGFGNMNGVGILRKEMEKRKRLKPLRVLFNEIPQVLQALKPCFLMSPLSVSTFLKPGAFNFDVVIFDEASQLPTPEAIPSILRAKQVIVAGDSNQLPPTSFFRSNMLNDTGEWEEGQVEELESLLDDCKAAVPYFQGTDLKWHYRSRNEKLINFSNHYFYGNRLITFPTPDTNDDKNGVVLEYVSDGVWDRGGSRVNRKEARHVAKLIIKHFETEPDKTLGVVALNSSQKEAIEEAVDEELANHKDIQPLMDPEKPEPYFVKSLENVQGDERDVIMISVGYGKAPDGTMTMNFGPINTEGGWRRLNVLVTRAKWRTVLVTSIRSSELSGINPENRGPMGLKNYIQYAETGFLNEAINPVKVLNEETNDFEDSVRRELELAGFVVDAQVGVGSFRIDLAVKDRKNQSQYAIGIECDGATYHSSRSARDRDILRQEVLQNMGWKIYRVWSTEWFRNREQSRQQLIENVNRAVNGTTLSPVSEMHMDAETNIELYKDDIDLASVPVHHKKPGTQYQKSQAKCHRDVVMKEIKKYQFVNLLVQIVHDEGPIHTDLLLERVKDLTKVSRAGANIQKNFDNALKIAIKNGYVEKNKDDKGFIYETGKLYPNFRVNGDDVQRRLSQICNEEIRNAVKYLIQEQFGLAYDNLVQSLRPLFGLTRTDPEENDRVKDIVDGMIASGQIVKQGPLLNLATKI